MFLVLSSPRWFVFFCCKQSPLFVSELCGPTSYEECDDDDNDSDESDDDVDYDDGGGGGGGDDEG